MIDLAIKLHENFMEVKEYQVPSFEAMLYNAMKDYGLEDTDGLRLMADAIDRCVEHWDQWTAEWLIELADSKAQARWEKANRGEL